MGIGTSPEGEFTWSARSFGPRRRALGAAAVVAVVIALAGCSSTVSSVVSGKTSAPEACTVLTPDLVTPVIGADAKISRQAQPNPHETQCQYTSSTGAIDIMVGDWSVIKPIDPDEQAVSGIGDEALISSMGLAVRKGNHGFSLQTSLAFGSFDGAAADSLQAQEEQAEKDLAPKLLPKL